MRETSTIGNASEARVLVALIEAGYVVCKPFGDGHKYDYVIDDGVTLQRVQCKTGRLRRGCVVFNSYSVAGNSNGQRQDYLNSCDLFAVYCLDNQEVYLVPVAAVGTTGVVLRVEETRNHQRKRVRWASEFRLVTMHTPEGEEHD